MKIAVSSYSYHQYIKEGKMTQLDALKKAAEQGFEGIEFTDLCPENKKGATLDEQLAYARVLRQEAEKLGVKIVAYLVGADLYKGDAVQNAEEVERVKGQVRVAAELGAPLMRHDVCRTERVGDRIIGFERMLPTIAENVRRITEYAATLGVRTCSENHGKIAQDSDRVERLWYAVNNENYGILVDIGNFACVDEDSVTAVSRLAPYAIHAHAKDFHKIPFGEPVADDLKTFATRGCNLLAGCALGDGDIPVEQCVKILRSAGYDGWISIEFEGNKDCIEEIALGYERLKTYINKGE